VPDGLERFGSAFLGGWRTSPKYPRSDKAESACRAAQRRCSRWRQDVRREK
jgi:hypothetical protein